MADQSFRLKAPSPEQMGVMSKSTMTEVKTERSEARLEEGERRGIQGLEGCALVEGFWGWTHTLEESGRPGNP